MPRTFRTPRLAGRVASVLALGAVPLALAGCGATSIPPAKHRAPTALHITSVTVKVVDGSPMTALRGTTTSHATVTVDGRETDADRNGAWAIRASYRASRTTIRVTATADGRKPTTIQVRQPTR